MWLSEKEASEILSIDQKTLEVLRERGFLKPGSHWRSPMTLSNYHGNQRFSILLADVKKFLIIGKISMPLLIKKQLKEKTKRILNILSF